MDVLQETVIRLYSQNVSIKEMERRKICSLSKARKILISAGIYPTARSVQIKEMIEAGATVPEIAKSFGVSVKAVNAYLPYVRGMKNAEYPSINALRIRACRARKRERLGGLDRPTIS